ncbi:hypothetical protein TBLA_0C06270 [Henningerozyma blattae CBS 6284]|uniref:Transcription initiation factor TFIID subunit 13 n=1 Tax=Henningerozyma blattae (strain ATCC 34711 / CBS 6284 / DSM 70876 / NBRC 10599 / NRRL Y-10934 / UCD 77-7) TaxID=1071380 RepID=I2H220_HENB6|nr:hypothetical protein TBLA_0C06270 [Tetrapisispora blattae CBS 6284]CCH60422.1 hypothetical protein TBLA_0C06270 [Tetrapisispora blattae CBS 6284]
MSRRLKKTNLFAKDVSSLLYAYGDVPHPLSETVQCLDELVSAYLVDICTIAHGVAQNSSRNKLKLEDFKFSLRKDPVKLSRAEELIATNKLIIEAKKQFNENDQQSLKRFRTEEDDERIEEEEEEEEDNDDHESSATKTDRPLAKKQKSTTQKNSK